MLFDSLATDGSKELDEEELTRAMKRLKLFEFPDQIKRLMDVADLDGNGMSTLCVVLRCMLLCCLWSLSTLLIRVDHMSQHQCRQCDFVWLIKYSSVNTAAIPDDLTSPNCEAEQRRFSTSPHAVHH